MLLAAGFDVVTASEPLGQLTPPRPLPLPEGVEAVVAQQSLALMLAVFRRIVARDADNRRRTGCAKPSHNRPAKR
jgi:hypothetical protein